MQGCLSNLNISAVSAVVPQQSVTMAEFYQRFGENEVKRISRSTGISSLKVAPKAMKTSDLCVKASEVLFDKLSVSRESIDAVIFVSQTPDYIMPATSCLLQQRLGLSKDVLAFDLNYGCSGYIYGLYQAGLLISSGQCQRVLLCVGDTMTKHLDPADQKTQLILGDGAAATLIERGDDQWAVAIKTDGSGCEALKIDKCANGQDGYLAMDGAAIMDFALREVPGIVDQVLVKKGWLNNEVDQFIFHQANQFMLNYLRKTMGLDKEKVPIAVEQYGNTGPASIPLALCHTHEQAGTCNQQKTILAGFGVGLSWGALAVDMSSTKFLGVTSL